MAKKNSRAGRRRALSFQDETEVFRRHVLLEQTAAEVSADFGIGVSTVGLICARIWEKLGQLSPRRIK